MMLPNALPLVRVTWLDAESSDEWEDRVQERSCSKITTIGHLIEESEEEMVLAMNFDSRNDSISMVMILPNHWVESVETLEPVR